MLSAKVTPHQPCCLFGGMQQGEVALVTGLNACAEVFGCVKTANAVQVCNHPDLFEGRAIISAFDMLPSISIQEPSAVLTLRQLDPASSIDFASMAPSALHHMSAWEAAEIRVGTAKMSCGL